MRAVSLAFQTCPAVFNATVCKGWVELAVTSISAVAINASIADLCHFARHRYGLCHRFPKIESTIRSNFMSVVCFSIIGKPGNDLDMMVPAA